jgi:hypothetical protein
LVAAAAGAAGIDWPASFIGPIRRIATENRHQTARERAVTRAAPTEDGGDGGGRFIVALMEVTLPAGFMKYQSQVASGLPPDVFYPLDSAYYASHIPHSIFVGV